MAKKTLRTRIDDLTPETVKYFVGKYGNKKTFTYDEMIVILTEALAIYRVKLAKIIKEKTMGEE